MTREEYLGKLQEQLEKFGNELQQEIMEDYNQHFAEGEAEGRTDEEIIQELGNIEDMIRELRYTEAEMQPDGIGFCTGAERAGIRWSRKRRAGRRRYGTGLWCRCRKRRGRSGCGSQRQGKRRRI